MDKAKVFIRPDDVAEAVLQICKKHNSKGGSISDVMEDVKMIHYCLKHEKFERLKDYFDIDF